MTESLTLDGFPRNDIDVYSVRHARVKIIEGRNDLKVINEAISAGLIQLHASGQILKNADGEAWEVPSKTRAVEIDKEFAIVNSVAPSSPAFHAELREGDLILRFGSVTSLAHIASYVQERKDRPTPVKVLRASKVLELMIIPKAWEGRGLLGCHLLPLDE